MPDTTQLTLFIQIAMSALAQANMTGNYTVLHALGAPSFQTANPPAKLSETFARTRASVDLVPIILYQPILTTPPAISAQGLLRLTGYYDTQPLNVMFDLLFVPVAGQWRMEGIAVQTRPAAAAVPPPQATSSQPPAPSAQSAPTKAAAPAKK